MDSYPPEFAGGVKRLAETARQWSEAQIAADDTAADETFQQMMDEQQELASRGVLGEDPCEQLHDMAVSAAAVTLCRVFGMAGLEEREEDFNHAKEPHPEEVSEQLWMRTQKLFWSAASLACAEAAGDDAKIARETRNYDRHARFLAGFGKHHQGRGQTQRGFDEDAVKVMPGNVVMFSGCRDDQTSADVQNTASFGIPEDAGPGGAGGACTSALIKALDETNDQCTWVSLLQKMRQILEGRYTQIPMLSGTRQIVLNDPFSMTHDSPSGRYRALLVGINYVGSKCELQGCHNDVFTMKTYLQRHGFSEDPDTMRILLDDGQHTNPTRANMLEGFRWLVEGASQGDSLFFHYSGHGASVRDDDGDEPDGKDETLCPVDYESAGLLRDDDAYAELVAPLNADALLTCVLDCCHSGTILDLPYVFQADNQNMQAALTGQAETLQQSPSFDFGKLMQVGQKHPVLCALGAAVAGGAYFKSGSDAGQELGSKLLGAIGSDEPLQAGLGAAMGYMSSKFG